jgi:hypothetical protein
VRKVYVLEGEAGRYRFAINRVEHTSSSELLRFIHHRQNPSESTHQTILQTDPSYFGILSWVSIFRTSLKAIKLYSPCTVIFFPVNNRGTDYGYTLLLA